MECHITKEGKKIKLSDLETYHLKNIINWIERKSKEGLKIKYGGGTCADDMYYDEDILYGKKALKQLKYKSYKKELEKRTKLNN
jgi:hypothetical protein